MTAFDLNRGAIAPVADEVDLVDLRVTGAIPHELAGTLLRNGPNPPGGRFEGSDVLSWWPEAAMLHAIAFDGGRVTATGTAGRARSAGRPCMRLKKHRNCPTPIRT